MFDRSKVPGSILALIALLVIGYVVIKKYNPSMFLSEFTNNDYYIPAYSDKNEDAKNAYLKMGGKIGSEKCPICVPEKTEYGLIQISNLGRKYPKMYWVLSNQEANPNAARDGNNDAMIGIVKDDAGKFLLSKDNKSYTVPGTSDKVYYINQMLGLLPIPSFNENSYLLLGDKEDKDSKLKLKNSKSNDVFQIIAPWDFTFADSNNIDRDPNVDIKRDGYSTKITIENVDNTQRITFTGVVNWFCAGRNTKDEKWASHWNSHSTIIGSSSNSKFKGGQGGTVIGYISAKKNPTITVEVKESGAWKAISVGNWLFNDNNDDWKELVKNFIK